MVGGNSGGVCGAGLAAGVRGLSGAVTVERTEDEKLKYPDRINLDRKGLHGKRKMNMKKAIPQQDR